MSDEKDVFAIYDNLRSKALGISDRSKPPEGFIVSFLPCGRPVNPDDYLNPWTPDLTTDTSSPGGSGTGTAGTSTGTEGGGTTQPDAQTLNQITKRQRNLMNLSRLVDHKLQMNGSGLVVPGSSEISNTWWAILQGANARPLPPINDPALKKRVEESTKLLMKPDPDDPEGQIETGTYQRYKDYRRKYYRAIQNYTAQYTAAMASPVSAQTWPVVGKAAFNECESAMEDWVSLGKKDKVEEALAVLGSQGTDAATALIHSAKKNYERWQVAAGMINATIPFVQVFPTNWCDLKREHDGWTEYGYSRTNTSSAASSEATSWGANAGVKFGFWSFGAGASHSSSHTHNELSSDGLGIRMRYAVIDIDRPWLNTVLLNVSNWFLVGYKKNSISQGTITQSAPSQDEAFWLPSLPTQMVVVKDLRIRTNNMQATYDAMQSKTAVGGSVGWGPFSIGGNYSHSEGKVTQTFHMEGEWLVVDGVQIIGWISQILPASPKLDAPNA